MDGRLVLLGLIVVIAVVVARDMDPARPSSRADLARERAADTVLVEVDRTQLCYRARRHRYAETVPSLQFAGGHFMRLALRHDLDIHLDASGDHYVQRLTGDGVNFVVERRGTEVVRLDVGDRAAPRLASTC